jgi:molybdate transport system substrate-binding protein
VRRTAVLLAAFALADSACIGSGPSQNLTVLAASSLSNAFPKIGAMFEAQHASVTVKFEFAGTDSLVVQIEQGAPADVFAGASTKYGDQLVSEGLVEPPLAFATNKLVLVVPASNPAAIASPKDLTRPIKLVIGDATVPIGAYTRKALSNLDATYGAGYSEEVLANVVSNEASVEGVLTKVSLGEADAGFVYVTDAMSAGPDVKVISLPDAAQAVATYPIAVVVASSQASLAGGFADLVLSSTGLQVLAATGFGPPPAG